MLREQPNNAKHVETVVWFGVPASSTPIHCCQSRDGMTDWPFLDQYLPWVI